MLYILHYYICYIYTPHIYTTYTKKTTYFHPDEHIHNPLTHTTVSPPALVPHNWRHDLYSLHTYM